MAPHSDGPRAHLLMTYKYAVRTVLDSVVGDRTARAEKISQVWPVLASFCMFSFKLTAVQPFWLHHKLEKNLLGVWMGLFEATRLITARCAPSPNATLLLTVLAAGSLGLAAMFITDSPSLGAWLLIATGIIDPSTTMMCRLRAENLQHKSFDKYAELAHTSYVVGCLLSTGMDALAALVGGYAIVASLAFVAGCNAVIAALVFAGRSIGQDLRSALKPARRSWTSTPQGERDDTTGEVEVLCLSPRSRLAARTVSKLVSNSRRVPIVRDTDDRRTPLTSASRTFRQPPQRAGLESAPSSSTAQPFDYEKGSSRMLTETTVDEIELRSPSFDGGDMTAKRQSADHESVRFEHEDVAIKGKRMLRLCVWMMTGVGAADSIILSLGPLFFADSLGAPPWVYFATALSMVSLMIVFGPLCTRFGVSYTPKNADVLLSWAGFLCAVIAIFPSNLPLAIVVYLLVLPCYDFVPRIVNRVVQSYASGNAIFDRYMVLARLGYQLGSVAASLVTTPTYFVVGPSVVFVGALGISILVATSSSWAFITDAVRLGSEQYVQLLELEAAAAMRTDNDVDPGTPGNGIQKATLNDLQSYVGFVRAASCRFSYPPSSGSTPRSTK